MLHGNALCKTRCPSSKEKLDLTKLCVYGPNINQRTNEDMIFMEQKVGLVRIVYG